MNIAEPLKLFLWSAEGRGIRALTQPWGVRGQPEIGEWTGLQIATVGVQEDSGTALRQQGMEKWCLSHTKRALTWRPVCPGRTMSTGAAGTVGMRS